ncbi:DMT family transporter [Hominibacterium faecale]|uniref:DMT family transporter n=1 Tax=Hominibacterium faecale TaxID=2839743 RepID=UPI0022B2AA97|nr:DMT family transporter [Hominibacterium faecale]
MNKKLRGNLLLLLTALIWGTSFVAQRAGMDYIEPFTFNGIRSLIGGIVLIPVIFFLGKMNPADDKEESTEEEKKSENKTLILGGISCGVILFVASSLQQFGVVYTTAGKAGFITALYIVIVPILSFFIGKKIRPIVWLCVLLSLAGLYLLCMKDGLSINKGDFLVLLCAFGFSIHILVIDHFSPKTDGVKMSCIQFFVCGIISLVPMAIFETPVWSDILDCWFPILYTGAISCGVAYTLQIIAQKDTDPTIASLLLSLESVLAAISGVLILHEQISPRELIGCIVMFAAIIIAQLPSKTERLSAKNHE